VTPAIGEPLAYALRSGEVESWHLGHLAVVGPDGRLLVSRGDPEAVVYVRSAAKPIQALPLWLTGAAEAFGLPPTSLAVAMASHSGEEVHTGAVQALLDAAGVDAALLGCGTHEPYHAATNEALRRAGTPPGTLHCNCSGKHAGFLAVARHMGWDLASYRDADHPLQRLIRSLLAELAGVPEASIAHGVDGCGAPVWRLPLVGLARAFAGLGSPDGLRPELAAAARAATRIAAAHPRLVAGEDRLDTDLVAAGAGALIAKIGGEAVHAGAWLEKGGAWAMKIGDGNRRAIGPTLARAAALVGRPLPEDPRLARHLRPEVRNNHGDVVGHVVPAW
jgi:L-asparaginase II